MANKGFIKDWLGNQILPITRGELVLDQHGQVALHSNDFLADIQKGLPGLMTAAEKAMLSGSGSGGGIADIYNKLDLINNGLKFNGTALHFYTVSENVTTASPINITATDGIALNILENTVKLGLETLKTDSTKVEQIIKSITVDKYGRVTEVIGAALTNDEIPEELSGKSIKNSSLEGCTVAVVGTGTDSVVNKEYVDKAITEVTGIATGALSFGGSLSSQETAITAVTEEQYANEYYKVTSSFTIPSQYLYSETESIIDKTVDVGDTLIVYPISKSPYEAKFVHVPSGDDITTITIREEKSSDYILKDYVGNVTLQFAPVFNIAQLSEGTASIDLPKADASNDGYLSKDDYILFNSYAENLKVQYESLITSTQAGAYTLGTLTIGSTPNIIYGLNTTYSLSLEEGTEVNKAYNPVLKFTEIGKDPLSITYKGLNGIVVRKNENNIEFLSANEILEGSENYLKINNNYQFGVKIGNIVDGKVVDGLTDYSEFVQLRTAILTNGVIFENITYSLNDEATPGESDPYRYGNEALKAAINVTI